MQRLIAPHSAHHPSAGKQCKRTTLQCLRGEVDEGLGEGQGWWAILGWAQKWCLQQICLNLWSQRRREITGKILISVDGLCNQQVTWPQKLYDITACLALVFSQSEANLPVRRTKPSTIRTVAQRELETAWDGCLLLPPFSLTLSLSTSNVFSMSHYKDKTVIFVCLHEWLNKPCGEKEESVLYPKWAWLTHQWEKHFSKCRAETKWPWSYCSGSSKSIWKGKVTTVVWLNMKQTVFAHCFWFGPLRLVAT